jgi:hypothetical protein
MCKDDFRFFMFLAITVIAVHFGADIAVAFELYLLK